MMRNNIRRNPAIWAVLTLLLITTVSCDRDNNNPGHIYYPDMAHARAYETYSENPVFKDGYTMREPAQGTIPRDAIPYPYQKTDEDRLMAAKMMVNPVEAGEEALERGKKMYGVYCIMCHGDTGDGKGHLYTSGKYTFPPASLVSEKMQAAPDADIFHVITVGHGIMGAHGSLVQPADRWKIALYVKNVLQK
jgi:mono/diheme cytochrome c family protein